VGGIPISLGAENRRVELGDKEIAVYLKKSPLRPQPESFIIAALRVIWPHITYLGSTEKNEKVHYILTKKKKEYLRPFFSGTLVVWGGKRKSRTNKFTSSRCRKSEDSYRHKEIVTSKKDRRREKMTFFNEQGKTRDGSGGIKAGEKEKGKKRFGDLWPWGARDWDQQGEI